MWERRNFMWSMVLLFKLFKTEKIIFSVKINKLVKYKKKELGKIRAGLFIKDVALGKRI